MIRADFKETRWSMVLKASAGSPEALEYLAQTYWYPVSAFLRRKGLSPEDAEDVTQGALSRLLASKTLEDIDPKSGTFRAYIRKCAEHEAAHLRDGRLAQKRDQRLEISIDSVAAELKFKLEPITNAAPDAIYDRAWSKIIVARALEKLEREYDRADKSHPSPCFNFVRIPRPSYVASPGLSV